MVRGKMKEGLENTVTDKTGKHPVQSDKYHCPIGVINHDIGTYPVEHLAEIDECKEPEENGREIR